MQIECLGPSKHRPINHKSYKPKIYVLVVKVPDKCERRYMGFFCDSQHHTLVGRPWFFWFYQWSLVAVVACASGALGVLSRFRYHNLKLAKGEAAHPFGFVTNLRGRNLYSSIS